ncbi:MAG: hypothetical protein LBH12_07160 [Dysgonamonadaceae bacterium]|jgi:hypothetical protein|nr:hypothetical protein [Dysgonamonadaceae bacterium]
MKTIQYFNIVFLSVICFASVHAQSNLDRELTLEREYNPSLRDANKINSLPQIKEPEAPRTKVEFSDYTLDYNMAPYITSLKAKSYFSDYAAHNKKGYLNLGVSSLIDLDGDLGYQVLNTRKNRLSLYYSHRSSNSKVTYLQKDEKQKMKLNDHTFGIDFNHFFDKAKLAADLEYTNAGFNYYGLSSHVDKNKTQSDNLFRAHLGIYSINSTNLSYKLNLHYTFFKQKHAVITDLTGDGRKENRLFADFDFNAPFNSTVKFGLGGYIKHSMYDISPDIFTTNTEDKIQGNKDYTALSGNPYFLFEGSNWNTRLGVSINTWFGGIKKFMLAPDIKFNWYPVESVLFYIRATGGFEDNSNYNMFYRNRYIDPNYRIYDSRIPVDGTVGVNFVVFPNFNMEFFGGFKMAKDEHFFIDNSYYGSTIVPLYAESQTFKFGGALNYAYRDIFNIGTKLTFYKWDTKEISGLYKDTTYDNNDYLKAWNKPNFEGDVFAGFKIPSAPLRFDANYHIETGRKALTENGMNIVSQKMKNIHSLNLKANYSVNDSFSVFAQANNLLNQKYDLWYGYPVQKINIIGGISIKF